MHKALKWLGIGTAAVSGLMVIATGTVYAMSANRLNRTFSVTPASLTIPGDPASLARGRHLAVAVAKCVDCHGADLSGKIFLDDPALGRIVATNLTRGKGGIAGSYTDADWIRSVRHGVRPDGKAAVFMPALEYSELSDEDLAAVIGYVKSVPPVDNTPPATSVGPLGRVLLLSGELPLLQAERVDHAKARPASMPPAPTAAYGKYLAGVGCIGCHGPNLAGGQVPVTPPGDPNFPPATNLTSAGPIGNWSEADFMRALRNGQRPDGSSLHPFMPWRYSAQMTDVELQALWHFVRSVPPQQTAQR